MVDNFTYGIAGNFPRNNLLKIIFIISVMYLCQRQSQSIPPAITDFVTLPTEANLRLTVAKYSVITVIVYHKI